MLCIEGLSKVTSGLGLVKFRQSAVACIPPTTPRWHSRHVDRISQTPVHTRRGFLLGTGALFVGACTTDGANDQSADPTSTTTSSPTTSAVSAAAETDGTQDPAEDLEIQPLSAEMFDALAICALTASAAEGPFPSQSPLNRREIHENYPGHPLRLGIRVVDQDCQPVPDATVDIWHTDASGDYSEYEDNGSGKDEGEGSSFCRGSQISDQRGIVEFLTIYPGWYDGRAVHIHASVHLQDQRILTAQLYLDESYSAGVFATGEYAQFGLPDTSWSDDSLIGDPPADGSFVTTSPAPTRIGAGTLGLMNLGVGQI